MGIENENNSTFIDLEKLAIKVSLDDFRNLSIDYKLNEDVPNQSAQAIRELLLKRNIY